MSFLLFIRNSISNRKIVKEISHEYIIFCVQSRKRKLKKITSYQGGGVEPILRKSSANLERFPSFPSEFKIYPDDSRVLLLLEVARRSTAFLTRLRMEYRFKARNLLHLIFFFASNACYPLFLPTRCSPFAKISLFRSFDSMNIRVFFLEGEKRSVDKIFLFLFCGYN